MKNQFDRQIRDAFVKNLEDIKASDDLIMRTLARVNAENKSDIATTKLTAINMGYIRKHEDSKAKRTATIRKIVLAGITLASAALLVINASSFIHSKIDTKVSESQIQVLEANAVSDTPDYSAYIHVSTPKTRRSYVSGAYSASYNQEMNKINKPLFDRTL